MKAVYVVDAVRTPIGKFGGALSHWRPDDLLAYVLRALLQRNESVDPARIEDVIAGAANQAGEDNRNVLHDILSLSDEEIFSLENDGVISSRIPKIS